MPLFSSQNSFTTSTGRDTWSWPVLMLLLAVLIPSGGVLWMMRQAMESERLAIRQRITDLYDVQLESARQQITKRWEQQLRETADKAGSISPRARFALLVTQGLADGVISWDSEDEILYPDSSSADRPTPEPKAWLAAIQLEANKHNRSDAAAEYGKLADAQSNSSIAARALQAQARCLLAMGDRNAAVETLKKLSHWKGSLQRSHRNLSANAELQLLEIVEQGSPTWNEIAQRLQDRLNDYHTEEMPGSQRRFLMRELIESWSDKFTFRTFKAELLTAEYLAAENSQPLTSDLHRTALADIWSWHDSTNRMTILLRTSTLKQLLSVYVDDQLLPTGVYWRSLAPDESLKSNLATQIISLAPAMPDWNLVITADQDPREIQLGSERIALFAWTALAVIAATLLLTSIVIRTWRKQLRVARLKNDLIATVSHELKTPLSSIRLLVDTLLSDEHEASAEQTRKYLELISQENARLTRLIDNFLTFSRLERGQQMVDFQPLEAAEVIAQAVTVVQERFAEAHAELTVETNQSAPIYGDMDLLVTAVVNLLDNARKYSDEAKRVVVSCQTLNDRVLISVTDNGIGLPPGATQKVFDRFYQIDQRVSRSQGGCGLGLSIVKSLVEAHGGEVSVQSQLDIGSTFTISLPLSNDSEVR